MTIELLSIDVVLLQLCFNKVVQKVRFLCFLDLKFDSGLVQVLWKYRQLHTLLSITHHTKQSKTVYRDKFSFDDCSLVSQFRFITLRCQRHWIRVRKIQVDVKMKYYSISACSEESTYRPLFMRLRKSFTRRVKQNIIQPFLGTNKGHF